MQNRNDTAHEAGRAEHARALRRRRLWAAVGVPSGRLSVRAFAVVEVAAREDMETAGLVELLRAARLGEGPEDTLYCRACGHGIADVHDPGEHDRLCIDGPEGDR